MRRPLVAGNWKMNGTRAEAEALVQAVVAGVAGVRNADVAICPPAILIPLVAERVRGSAVAVGGQTVSEYASGAYTGEVSGTMLRDYGCRYAIVGHSERRAIYGESDAQVAKKFQAAQKVDLIPMLCVGETLQEREANQTERVVERQLDAVIELAGIASFAKAIIAYEPVWAIGTGKVATPAQAQAVHAFIRGKLARLDAKLAATLTILYGGSVKANNARELFQQGDIDGGLIGGASLVAEEFLGICRAAE